MPNVTIFTPPSHFVQNHDSKVMFMRECTDICTAVLGAEENKVHIIFVNVLESFTGKDAYIEIKFRYSDQRTQEVMNKFMQLLENIYIHYFSKQPRIRCFAYQAENIFARN
tara:strand:+ start:9191 stop:9523 length:333 start_codon:yes stop_codon:yes gene_type:complete